MKKSNKNFLAFSLLTIFCSCSKIESNYLKQEKGQVESKKYGVSLTVPQVVTDEQGKTPITNAYPIQFTNPETKETITFASQNDKSPMFFKTLPIGSDVIPTVDEAHMCNMSVSDQSTAMTKIINATCTARNSLALDPSKLNGFDFPVTLTLKNMTNGGTTLSSLTFGSKEKASLTYFPVEITPDIILGIVIKKINGSECSFGTVTLSDTVPNIFTPQKCQ